MFRNGNQVSAMADKAQNLAKISTAMSVLRHLGNGKQQKKKPHRSDLPLMAGAFAGGALLMYILDPQQGRRRRHIAVDRTAGAARRLGRRAGRRSRYAAGHLSGAAERVTHAREPLPDYNDPTLAHKIESEVLRRPQVDAGRINVNVERGVAVLRGTVERPRDIRKLERKVASVPGVRGVKNLLHLENTPAPH